MQHNVTPKIENKQPGPKGPLYHPGGREKVEKPLSGEHYAKTNTVIKDGTGVVASQTEKPAKEDDLAPSATVEEPLKKPDTADTSNIITRDEKESVKSSDVVKTGQPKGSNAVSLNAGRKQKKATKSFIDNFGINLSAGPDVSAVRLSNAGKITLTYGAGLSYSFGHRFTLRAGFYVAEKIYSVDEAEYYVPPGSTWNNYLQSIDANCKVYEIPLTVSYIFDKNKNHNWFASAGLSSYLMKRESYVYYYKNSSGITWDRPWTVTNKNKNYFSVLDISGGYEYSFNNHVSVMAEPYVKMPLSGVGLGKIKLNSAGILFTVAVKPFK